MVNGNGHTFSKVNRKRKRKSKKIEILKISIGFFTLSHEGNVGLKQMIRQNVRLKKLHQIMNESFMILFFLSGSKGLFRKKYAFHVENHIPVSALTCSAGIGFFFLHLENSLLVPQNFSLVYQIDFSLVIHQFFCNSFQVPKPQLFLTPLNLLILTT